MPSSSHGSLRALVAAIQAAGGQVELTARNHLKVTGPSGVAHVAPPGRGAGNRQEKNTRATLRRYAGVTI